MEKSKKIGWIGGFFGACALGVFLVAIAYPSFWASTVPGPSNAGHRSALFRQGIALLTSGLVLIAFSVVGFVRWILNNVYYPRLADVVVSVLASLMIVAVLLIL